MDATIITVPATIHGASAAALTDALMDAANAPSRVVVLEGRPSAFCRGLDFAELGGDLDVAGGVAAFANCLAAIRHLDKPVIAVVEGEALGGGLGIAAACDVVVASERSTFGLPEVLFGLAPAVIMPVLLDRMSPQQARLLALSARTRSAAEALALGLVDVVVPGESLASAVRRQVRELGRCRPDAASTVKDLMRAVSHPTFLADLAGGVERTVATLARPEVVARIRAFLATGDLPWEDA